jgi:hypothetical protein
VNSESEGARTVNDFVPTAPANVTIGVCGEQNSGKTIFLTCIFQSIWTAFPDDVILDFDREDIGNADYFRDVEERLITKAATTGTLAESLYRARIYVRPYVPLPDALPPVLSVDLQDFAGRHFRSLANLKALGANSDLDPEEVKALREVNDTLKKADAFIILINSKEIDPLDETPKRNPFSPSVNFMISHCRAEKKPIALLFSQIDQTPRLTEEVFHTLPRVKAFERQFTSDHAEAEQGERPFGIVRRIACYETVEGDLAPLRQTLDGSIWRPEPAEVVLELIRAAMPNINDRLRFEAEAAHRRREDGELAAQRRRRQRLLVGAGTFAAVLLIIAFTLLTQRRQRENQQVQLLAEVEARISQGRIASIPAPTESALRTILSTYRTDRGATSSAVRSAIRNLHAAFGEAAQRLADEPALDPAYSAEIARFRSLAPLFDPENTATWRTTLLPLLEARTAFLSEWFNANRQGRERLLVLDEAARQFSTADEVFARVLAAQSVKEKLSSVASGQPRRTTRDWRHGATVPGALTLASIHAVGD